MSKIYVSPNAYLGRSETFHRDFQTAICRTNRNETIKVLLVIFLFSQTKYSYIKRFNIFYYPPIKLSISIYFCTHKYVSY